MATKNRRHCRLTEQLHDKVMLIASTGIHPDETNWLEHPDVGVIGDDATNETVLEIEVRDKRGVGYHDSIPEAVLPFQKMVERHQPEPTVRLFPTDHKKQFIRILGLKFGQKSNRYTLFSLLHSYISFYFLKGADIHQIPKNCRTSVEMIEKHNATHLKNSLDPAATYVRKRRIVSGQPANDIALSIAAANRSILPDGPLESQSRSSRRG